MANIKIKNLDKVFKAIQDACVDLPESMYNDLEKMTIERIVAKARTGKTMASGKEDAMKKLDPEYIEYRKQIAHASKNKSRAEQGKKASRRTLRSKYFNSDGEILDDSKFSSFLKSKGRNPSDVKPDPEFFKPEKSNLTLTGQYLRSFKRTKLDRRNGKMTIEPAGTRPEGLSNKQLAEYLGEQGRSIFGLDSVGKTRLFQRVKEELRRRLKRK